MHFYTPLFIPMHLYALLHNHTLCTLHTSMHLYTPLHTPTHPYLMQPCAPLSYIPLCTLCISTHLYTPLYTPMHPYTPLCTSTHPMHPFVPLCTLCKHSYWLLLQPQTIRVLESRLLINIKPWFFPTTVLNKVSTPPVYMK